MWRPTYVSFCTYATIYLRTLKAPPFLSCLIRLVSMATLHISVAMFVHSVHRNICSNWVTKLYPRESNWWFSHAVTLIFLPLKHLYLYIISPLIVYQSDGNHFDTVSVISFLSKKTDFLRFHFPFLKKKWIQCPIFFLYFHFLHPHIIDFFFLSPFSFFIFFLSFYCLCYYSFFLHANFHSLCLALLCLSFLPHFKAHFMDLQT